MGIATHQARSATTRVGIFLQVPFRRYFWGYYFWYLFWYLLAVLVQKYLKQYQK